MEVVLYSYIPHSSRSALKIEQTVTSLLHYRTAIYRSSSYKNLSPDDSAVCGFLRKSFKISLVNMEGHSDSESINSPHNNNIADTSYSRMNSEVFEKPSHFEEQSPSNCEDIIAFLTSSSEGSPEVCVLGYGSQSPCSSSKTDGELKRLTIHNIMLI